LSAGSIDRQRNQEKFGEILEGGKTFIQRQDIYGIKIKPAGNNVYKKIGENSSVNLKAFWLVSKFVLT
jgi:hypothetical protein